MRESIDHDAERGRAFSPHSEDASLYSWPEFDLDYVVDESDALDHYTLFPGTAEDPELRTLWISADGDSVVALPDIR